MWPFKKKLTELSVLEEIMVDYLKLHGEKDQKWHETVNALQSIKNKDILDSAKVEKWLNESGVTKQDIDFIKFNKPPQEPAIFKKMDKKLLEATDSLWIFQETADHISGLFEKKEDHVYGVEKLLDAPQCVKNIHYLWLFNCEVGSGGLHNYVINYWAEDLEWLLTHKALKAIQAEDLLQRFESCISLGLKDKNLGIKHDASNFTTIKLHDNYNSYDKIDDGIYELISEPFEILVTDYIKKHKHEIFE
jgi:hypothetical protein